MYRQPGWTGEFLHEGLSLGLEVRPSSFPVVAPIQTLATAVAVGCVFSVHAAQASGAYWVTAAMLQPDNFCYWARDPIGNRISYKAYSRFFGFLQ